MSNSLRIDLKLILSLRYAEILCLINTKYKRVMKPSIINKLFIIFLLHKIYLSYIILKILYLIIVIEINIFSMGS
jgi:hypothetical protein